MSTLTKQGLMASLTVAMELGYKAREQGESWLSVQARTAGILQELAKDASNCPDEIAVLPLINLHTRKRKGKE